MPDLIETRSNGSGICEICSKSRSFKSFASIIFFYDSLCISTQTNVFLDALASLKPLFDINSCFSRFCHLLSDVASDCLNSALETLSKTKIATKTNKEDKDKSKVHCTSVRTNFGLVLLGFHTLSLIFI